MAPHPVPMERMSSNFPFVGYWIFSAIIGFSSIIILILCTKRKKQYAKNDEVDIEGQRSRASTNNEAETLENQADQRLSQHSMPNEHRTLPDIPKNVGNGTNNPAPPTPDQVATPGGVSVESTQRNSASSPKKSRRLPALPPAEQVDLAQAAEIARCERDDDATYEDLRDDVPDLPDPQAETVGSGDSALYAKVPDDLQKGDDEDNDLYAQVDLKPETANAQAADEGSQNASVPSDDDKTVDSPIAVAYASVDKTKKTMSIKRRLEPTPSAASAGPAPPPPVPDRIFEEEEAESENPTESRPLLPPPAEADISSSNSVLDNAGTQDEDEETGPAYDTVSVRESFAHQRLRHLVEEERRNRYVNTSRGQPDLYSQIDEDNPEAVYESVSTPGSADGTVGVTGRNLPTAPSNAAEDPSSREDGYSTIEAARGQRAGNAPSTPPVNGDIANSAYEDNDPA